MDLIKFKNVIEQYKVPVDIIYDIGACIGTWTEQYKHEVSKNSKFYLFEANKECQKYLKNYNSYLCVLSNTEKKTVYYTNGGIDTGESLYLENTKHYTNPVEVEVRTTTLNKICYSENIPMPDLIKIDTQGSELDILKGGENIWTQASFLILELPFIEYNKKSPNINQILKYLASFGFYPFFTLGELFSEEYLVQIDLLFINKKIKESKISRTNYLIL